MTKGREEKTMAVAVAAMGLHSSQSGSISACCENEEYAFRALHQVPHQ